MKCKDCLYNPHCIFCDNKEFTPKERLCFSDRSEWVHLPCVAMVEQFIKDGKFDRKRTAHNGRTAVVYMDKNKWNTPLIDITEQFYNTDKAQERIQALKERHSNDT